MTQTQNGELFGGIGGAAISKPQDKDFFGLPTSSATPLLFDVFNYGKDIDLLDTSRKSFAHRNTTAVFKGGNSRKIVYTKDKDQIELELGNIKELANSKLAKKLLIFVLKEGNEQIIHNGQVSKDNNKIYFTFQTLADMGLYKNSKTARVQFLEGIESLIGVKLSAKLHKGRKIVESKTEVLFTGGKLDGKGGYTLAFNPDFNWSSLCQYFTYIPKYFFSLTPRGTDLLFYISYLARQNTGKIEKEGHFNIKFSSLHHYLKLPDMKKSKDLRRDMLDQGIIKAVQDIIDHDKGSNLKLTLVFDENKSVAEIMQTGYLQITPIGEYAGKFLGQEKKKQKAINARTKREEKRLDQAIALKMAEGMKEQESATKKATTA